MAFMKTSMDVSCMKPFMSIYLLLANVFSRIILFLIKFPEHLQGYHRITICLRFGADCLRKFSEFSEIIDQTGELLEAASTRRRCFQSSSLQIHNKIHNLVGRFG